MQVLKIFSLSWQSGSNDFQTIFERFKEYFMKQNLLYKILSDLKSQHEGAELELKKSSDELSADFWETYSSFSNTSGGYIILGINEKPNFEITGVTNPQKIVSDICNLANNPEKVSQNVIENSNIHIHDIEGKSIISVYIPELPLHKKPLYLKGNYKNTYIRKNEGDYKATDEDLRRFLRNAQDNIDNELLDNYTLEDLNPESVLAFKNIVHGRQPSKNFLSMENQAFLNEMGVFQIDRNDGRKFKLTLAGLLFLGNFDAITQKIPHFHLEYINRRGITTGRWKDRVSTGDLNYPNLNLFEFHRIVLSKLRTTIEDPFELDENSVRKSNFELDTALRESLSNMLIHADYQDPETMIKVTVDDLYYTFLNPGSMRISKSQFFTGGVSYPRNNTLMTFFRRIGASERSGTGGPDILKFASLNKYRLPELTTSIQSTEIKLWIAAPVDTFPEFSENTKRVFNHLNQVVNAKTSDIQKATGLSRYAIHVALNELLAKNVITVSGKGPATKYSRTPSIMEQMSAINFLKELIIQKHPGNQQ